MEPRELVQAWVDAFNRADVAALAALYSEDATNHQVAERPVVGDSGMAGSARPAGLRVLPCRRGPDQIPARLLGQAQLPALAWLADSAGAIEQHAFMPSTAGNRNVRA